MIGREPRDANNLLFVCFMIQSLSRMTKNSVSTIVTGLGKEALSHYFELADVYHSENPNGLFPRIISKHAIPRGRFDNVAACRYRVPTPMDIAKVFQRLILAVAKRQDVDLMTGLIQVYASDFASKIEDYNSSLYFENPEDVLMSYLASVPSGDEAGAARIVQ